MNQKYILSQPDFDSLLVWLSPDREKAGVEYEKIRQGLLRYFYFKGCSNGEDLTDEVINRVIRKLPDLDLTLGNKAITIFYGFASRVVLEQLKREKRELPLEQDFGYEERENDDRPFDCLERCMNLLAEADRRLVIAYYSENRNKKLELRRKLAEQCKLTPNAMHVKLHRLRSSLKQCIEKCVKSVN